MFLVNLALFLLFLFHFFLPTTTTTTTHRSYLILLIGYSHFFLFYHYLTSVGGYHTVFNKVCAGIYFTVVAPCLCEQVFKIIILCC